jgi:hypothetical protein
MPRRISKTPHAIDHVEVDRTMPNELCCAINTSSKRDERSILRTESILRRTRTPPSGGALGCRAREVPLRDAQSSFLLVSPIR